MMIEAIGRVVHYVMSPSGRCRPALLIEADATGRGQLVVFPAMGEGDPLRPAERRVAVFNADMRVQNTWHDCGQYHEPIPPPDGRPASAGMEG